MEYPFLMRCLLEYGCGMASVKECQEPSSFEDSTDRGAVDMTGACISRAVKNIELDFFQ